MDIDVANIYVRVIKKEMWLHGGGGGNAVRLRKKKNQKAWLRILQMGIERGGALLKSVILAQHKRNYVQMWEGG